jgi:pimeloyl-ACP methyl ester carboxylesterase
MRRLKGTKTLVHRAIDATVDLVGQGHESTARTVVRAASLVEPLALPVRRADSVRRLLTFGVLGSVKAVNRVVELVSDVAIDVVGPLYVEQEPPVPLRSDTVADPALVADAAMGVVNGFVGDHLATEGNPLDLGLALRSLTHWIEPSGMGIPEAPTGRIVVLVHGLAATEWSWCFDAERHLGAPDLNFGTLLARDLGFTPIYVRYNTGRHISQNGRALAAALDALVASWPVPVEELVLVGHSMGGLVSRSACHVAGVEQQAWIRKVQRVVTLGSPMQGAPLERMANLAGAVLGHIDLPGTLISAEILKARSAGIKDLRHGYVQDREWEGRDPDRIEGQSLRLELPDHLAWCFIAGTVTKSASNPVSAVMGDLLVQVRSAQGPVHPPAIAERHHVGGLHHAAIQVHPEVYRIVREFLTPIPGS